MLLYSAVMTTEWKEAQEWKVQNDNKSQPFGFAESLFEQPVSCCSTQSPCSDEDGVEGGAGVEGAERQQAAVGALAQGREQGRVRRLLQDHLPVSLFAHALPLW